MKKLTIMALLIIVSTIQSQTKNQLPYTFGKISPLELQMKAYDKDTKAHALVLFEHSNISFHGYGSYDNYFINKVYRKIKIFNENAYHKATVKIYLYKSESGGIESIQDLKAFTFNSSESRTALKPDQVFRKSLNERYDEVSFTFPNLKPGSVIEYQYEIKSEFFFNLVGWNFQSDIPKLRSEFHAVIPGFWNYNRHLNGSLPLTTNRVSIINECYEIKGAKANCEDLTYAISNVPAFKEEEKYSTSKKNYISKIEFELSRINRTDGTSKEYTTTWADTDQFLKQESSVGKQLKIGSHLKKNLPKELFQISEDKARAEAIYYYLQNHFSLDEKNAYLYKDVHAKKAFDNKSGSVPEINLSLINALNEAGLDSKIMLVSTRDNGFPTKKHPVFTDFNYLLAHVTINDKVFLLDASDKYMRFGQTPFKTLNDQGRVLDFKQNSYWYTTSPKISSQEIRIFDLKLNLEGLITGKVAIKSKGYEASSKRKRITELPHDNYLAYLEGPDSDMVVENYKNERLTDLDSVLIEEFDIEMDLEQPLGQQTYFNPMVIKYASNPFQLEERNYPVNFGYKIDDITKIKINIPKGYKISNLPKPTLIKLPNNGGSYIANYHEKDGDVLIFSHLKLNYTVYKPEKYKLLKELFKEIIKTSNSLISLEKTTDS